MNKDKLQRLFLNKTNKVLLQLFRYTFVGGFAFVVDFGLLWLLTDVCGLYYILSATLSFSTGLCVNYFISVKVVFFESKVCNKKLEFFFVGVIGVVGLALNNGLLWFFTEQLAIYYLFSKIIAAILVYLWNFFARRYLLFDKKK
ncbi:MAG: GtrA family protein [Bacteroidales bacterium]|jgi:putative flippase GtrA|nr:GtrA family protein [Bacteroidales bacterium]